METLDYKGFKILYEVERTLIDGFSETYTVFYYGEEEVVTRKYIFFGKKTVKKIPRQMMSVYGNIYDVNLSKDFWHKKLDRVIELIEREIEIENGQLV